MPIVEWAHNGPQNPILIIIRPLYYVGANGSANAKPEHKP